MDIPTSTAYLAEIAPARHRGKILGSLTQVTWIFGALTSTLVAVPLAAAFGDAAWRWMFALAAVPALLVLLGRRACPKSPRWLIARGRQAEAREACEASASTPTDERSIQPGTARSWGECSDHPMRKRLGWVTVIFFLNCLAGPIATVATPYVIRNVGALSVNATLLFSTRSGAPACSAPSAASS